MAGCVWLWETVKGTKEKETARDNGMSKRATVQMLQEAVKRTKQQSMREMIIWARM